MIEEAKFRYFLLGKAFEKQTKTIEGQGKKQIKPFQDHRKQVTETNQCIKKYFNIDRNSTPLDKQKKVNELIEERSSGFRDLQKELILKM